MDKMLTHGTVYSGRDGVNVILPGTGPGGEGNHYFPRVSKGQVMDVIRERIYEVITDEARIGARHGRKVAQCYATPPGEVTPGPQGRGVGWAHQPLVVTVREGHTSRREYAFTVWSVTMHEVVTTDPSRTPSGGISGITEHATLAEAQAHLKRLTPTLAPGCGAFIRPGYGGRVIRP